MLTLTELTEIASAARRSLFRLETLDRYEVPIDGSDLSGTSLVGSSPTTRRSWPGRSTFEPSGPPGSGGTGCTSSTPPTGWGATCVTNANGIHGDHRRGGGRPHP